MRPLRHPVAIAALALWVLNDHLFKALWPGLVTGKLSDIAGMVVTPLLLIAIGVRPWIAASVVALAFALAKTWLPANEAYCLAVTAMRAPLRAVFGALGWPLWRERAMLVRDPTDLVAVPFGAVALWIARVSTAAAPERPSESSPLAQRSRRAGRSA